MAEKEQKLKCPYTALKKPCVEHECPKWTKLILQDPQTGAEIDQWACSDTWLPIMLAEVSQKLVRMDATLESHRNAAAKSADNLTNVITQAENINIKINEKLIEVFQRIELEAGKQAAFAAGKAESQKQLED